MPMAHTQSRVSSPGIPMQKSRWVSGQQNLKQDVVKRSISHNQQSLLASGLLPALTPS